MLFNIDQDSGNRISGWVMPNNPSAVPRIRLVIDDEVKGVFPATQYRPLLKEQGLHDTGVCGFVVDETVHKDIKNTDDLYIFDDDTNLLLYRRRPPGKLVETKLLRIETKLLRVWPINEYLESHFHMSYAGIDMLPEQTVIALMAMPFTNSIYLTGRIFVRAIEHQMRDRGFKSAILIRDPFDELAERLLALKWVSSNQGARVMPFLGKLGQAAARRLRDADLSSVAEIEKMLENLDADSQTILTNSLTRQLALQGSVDTLDKYSVSAALDTLAEIDVIGMNSDVPGFMRLLNMIIQNDDSVASISLPPSPRVDELAKTLRGARNIERIIAMDVELYNAVGQAFQAVDRQEGEMLDPLTKVGS